MTTKSSEKEETEETNINALLLNVCVLFFNRLAKIKNIQKINDKNELYTDTHTRTGTPNMADDIKLLVY